MRIKRTTSPTRRSRAVRLLAAAIGLASVTAVALPGAAAATAQPYSADQLARVSQAVLDSNVEGAAWRVDSGADRVVVTVDRTVTPAAVAKIRRAAGADAGALRIDRRAGVFTPLLSAGDAIYGGNYRCSLGFNVVSGSTYYFLTAGHCGNVANTWYTDAAHSELIGPTISSSFPGTDYALVRYDNTALTHPGGFTAANAYVGELVTRTGSTTGTHTGTVTALNVTVRYSGGSTVRGLIQTTVCAEPGDSGGPLYDGTLGLGITSGGSGDCSSGGTTFFQPVTDPLAKYNVTLL